MHTYHIPAILSPGNRQRSRRMASIFFIALAICVGSSTAFARKAKPAQQPLRGEQAEIESVLREMQYLRERVEGLKGRYGRQHSRHKIRFNYDALLGQIRTSEAGIRDFLNARIDEIHTSPPSPVGGSLIRVRPN